MTLHGSTVATPPAHASNALYDVTVEPVPADVIAVVTASIEELRSGAEPLLIRVTGDDRHDLVAVSVEREGAERLLFFTAENATATAWFAARAFSGRFGVIPVLDLAEYSDPSYVIKLAAD